MANQPDHHGNVSFLFLPTPVEAPHQPTMPLAHLCCALLEPQRSDNDVGVLVVIVLSASRLAVVAAVVAVAVVLWSTIDVAVRWFVAVFVESVLTSLSWVTAVQSGLVVSVVVHVAVSSSDPLHLFLSAGDAI